MPLRYGFFFFFLYAARKGRRVAFHLQSLSRQLGKQFHRPSPAVMYIHATTEIQRQTCWDMRSTHTHTISYTSIYIYIHSQTFNPHLLYSNAFHTHTLTHTFIIAYANTRAHARKLVHACERSKLGWARWRQGKDCRGMKRLLKESMDCAREWPDGISWQACN